jgi:tetratricopeptide (TPR) repeat protein
MAELWLASKTDDALRDLTSAMNQYPATAAETAAEYMNAGLWQDGTDVLVQSAKTNPFTYYYLGYFAEKMGQTNKATEYYALAAKMSPEYGFPFQYEMVDVLRSAMKANPRDARAPYYLGNLLFDWQPEEAAKLWELSARIDPSLPIVHRNLAIAFAYKQHSTDKAIHELETAVSLTPKYARHFAELDDLYRAAGTDPNKRLALFEQNQDVIAARDDSLAHEIALLVSVGKYDEAIQRLTAREFSVWEGANLDVAGNWTDAHIFRGRERLSAGKANEALADFQAALQIPSNLPSEGVEVSKRKPEVEYWIGEAYRALGKPRR